jgi:glycosyltransferase involved in cell wall biosynthesis
MKNILIISGDVVDIHMGGVGVRNWELARSLARYCTVTLAIPNQSVLKPEGFILVSFDLEKDSLRELALSQDAIILHGFVLHFHPYLRELGVPIAIDLYVPSLLEGLVWHDHDDWDRWIPEYEEYSRVQGDLIRAGDFFFCASEQQRDYWLGWLNAQKRINPHTYRSDPTLRKLIDVVSFGIPENSLVTTKTALKGVHPGIGKDDRLILWSGGLWDWLDPLTLVRAMALLRKDHPDYKLYFMGTRHPNAIIQMSMPDRVIQLSKELDLFDRSIFFGKWIPYGERQNYLAEADLSVVSHADHVETHFSYRTRVLDCIWANIPLIITEGDAMSDLVSKEGLGISIPSGDEKAMASAIEKVLSDPDRQRYKANFERIKPRFYWDPTIKPLIQFCQNPGFAPDKGKYLTEAEKIAQDKDAFLEKVVREKNAYFQQTVRGKDAYIEQIIRDKDAFLEKVVKDKDAYLEQVVIEKDRYWQSIVDEKDRIIRHPMRLLIQQIIGKIKGLFGNPS